MLKQKIKVGHCYELVLKDGNKIAFTTRLYRIQF
jgi:hypothetical protein